MLPVTLTVAALATGTIFAQPAASPAAFVSKAESTRNGVAELKGQVVLQVNGAPVTKRFVLRHPAAAASWNGSLVIGAHGGSGGNNFDPTGKVIGTD